MRKPAALVSFRSDHQQQYALPHPLCISPSDETTRFVCSPLRSARCVSLARAWRCGAARGVAWRALAPRELHFHVLSNTSLLVVLYSTARVYLSARADAASVQSVSCFYFFLVICIFVWLAQQLGFLLQYMSRHASAWRNRISFSSNRWIRGFRAELRVASRRVALCTTSLEVVPPRMQLSPPLSSTVSPRISIRKLRGSPSGNWGRLGLASLPFPPLPFPSLSLSLVQCLFLPFYSMIVTRCTLRSSCSPHSLSYSDTVVSLIFSYSSLLIISYSHIGIFTLTDTSHAIRARVSMWSTDMLIWSLACVCSPFTCLLCSREMIWTVYARTCTIFVLEFYDRSKLLKWKTVATEICSGVAIGIGALIVKCRNVIK